VRATNFPASSADCVAVANGLDSRAWHNNEALPARCGEGHGDVHTEPQAWFGVQDCDTYLCRTCLRIDSGVNVADAPTQRQTRVGRCGDGRL
jgi:hypothetical protein